MALNLLHDVKVIDPEGDLILEVGDLSLPNLEKNGSKGDSNKWITKWDSISARFEEDFAGQNSASEEVAADAEAANDGIANGKLHSVEAMNLDSANRDPQDERPSITKEQQRDDIVIPYRRMLRILVCSKVLTWASPVFKKMLNGPFAEGQKAADPTGRRTLRLPEDEPWTVCLLCNILHHSPKVHGQYTYNVLEDMAIFSDKYGLSKSLRSWFRGQLRDRIPTSHKHFEATADRWSFMRCLETMKLAYLTDDAVMFGQATVFYAYLTTPETTEAQLQEIFKERSSPDGLVDRLAAMQAYHIKKASALGPEALVELTEGWRLLGRPSCAGSRTQDYATRGTFTNVPKGNGSSYEAICEGRVKLLGVVAASLAGMYLWPNPWSGHSNYPDEPVQYFIERYRVITELPLEGKEYRCRATECNACSSASATVAKDLKYKLTNLLEELGRDGVCLQCVKENRPFTRHEVGPCTIHKVASFH